MAYVSSKEFVRGVKAAASVAADYNGSTTHAYRLEDCITMKLNVTPRLKARRNQKQISDPKAELNRGVILGVALALAEVYRLSGSSSVAEAARSAGVTLGVARGAGVDAYDVKELRRAGVR